jgi:hypothetical protein
MKSIQNLHTPDFFSDEGNESMEGEISHCRRSILRLILRPEVGSDRNGSRSAPIGIEPDFGRQDEEPGKVCRDELPLQLPRLDSPPTRRTFRFRGRPCKALPPGLLSTMLARPWFAATSHYEMTLSNQFTAP